MGKPVIRKVKDGSLAAVRQVEHSRDSHLLEEIRFSDDQITNVGKQQDVEVNHLCVILALCLDFANHNPRFVLLHSQYIYICRIFSFPTNLLLSYQYLCIALNVRLLLSKGMGSLMSK